MHEMPKFSPEAYGHMPHVKEKAVPSTTLSVKQSHTPQVLQHFIQVTDSKQPI